MKWFSISGIITEIKRIRWPKGKELMKNSGIVLVFVLFLGVFFFLCQIVSSGFLKLFEL